MPEQRKLWDRIYLSLIPSVWAEGFHLITVCEHDVGEWEYAIVCDCCQMIKFEGTASQCREWLKPILIPNFLN